MFISMTLQGISMPAAAHDFDQQNLNAAFLRAAECGDAVEMKSLHEKGARLNAIGKGGANALILASKGGFADAVVYLTKQGAAADHQDDNGNTALHFAAAQKDGACLRMIFTTKPNPDLPDGSGTTPVFIAQRCGNTQNLKELLNVGVFIDQRNPDGNTLLIEAEKLGQKEIVTTLLDLGADYKIKGFKNETVTVIAALRDDWETALRLVEGGADLGDRDRNANAVLSLAQKAEATDVINAIGDRLQTTYREGTKEKLKAVPAIRFRK